MYDICIYIPLYVQMYVHPLPHFLQEKPGLDGHAAINSHKPRKTLSIAHYAT